MTDAADFSGSIAVDDEGFICVADVGIQRIQVFAPLDSEPESDGFFHKKFKYSATLAYTSVTGR